MNQLEILFILCICLFLSNLYTQVRFYFERKRYLGLIDRLTDKLMSRDFTDYAMGQSLKDDKTELVAHKPRTDEAEAVIEQENNQKIGELQSKLKHLDEKLENVG